MVVSMALGWGDAMLHEPEKLDLKALEGSIVRARIDEITFSDFSMSMRITMLSARDKNRTVLAHPVPILLTTNGCDYNYQPGDEIAFACKLSSIKGLRNPDGFDYANYMLDNGIRYSQHLRIGSIVKTGQVPTLVTRCNKKRRELQLQIFSSTLKPEIQNFVVATVLGNSHFITPLTRSAFAAAGISHVLALSGLHVGILMMVVWFVLFPFDYMKLRRLRLGVTIVIMAAYALFTGLSPSVVRATIMTSMALIGMIVYRKSISLNSLMTAALFLLAVDPASMFSVGFQLSFVTVASLLLFMGQVKYKKTKNAVARWKRRVVMMALTSTVAMVSTIMLTAWYFGAASLLSVVGNVIILPVFPVLMVCSVVFTLLIGGYGIEIPVMDKLIEVLYGIVHGTARVAGETLPGHIDGIYVTVTDVMLYYIALAMLFVWYYRHRFKWVNYAMLSIAMIPAHHVFNVMTQPHSGLVIFNDYYTTPVLSFENGTGTLWVPDGKCDITQFKQYNKRFLAHYGIDSIAQIPWGDYKVMGGHRIVCVSSNKWASLGKPPKKIDIDVLVISKKFHKDIEKLCNIFAPRTIVLSGNIYDGEIDALTDGCRRMGIPYYSIKDNGAYIDIN